MPSIRTHIPSALMEGRDQRPLPMLPCVWCGEPTALMAETPFRPDLGMVPLMLTCGAQIIYLYGLARNGEPLPIESKERLVRLMTTPLELPPEIEWAAE